MSSPVENPIVLDLTPTLGYMLIGTVFCFVIWGITCMQTFMYFSGYPDDHGFMKTIIGTLWMIDTANVALLLCGLWPPLIGKWGSVAAATGQIPDIVHHNWLSGIIVATVQLVFLWRIYKLGGGNRWTWPVVICVGIGSVYDFVGAAAFSAIALKGNTLATENEKILKGLQISSRSCTAAADITICVCLIALLLRNGLPHYTSTRGLLFRSILVTVNSGLWTAILAIIDLTLMSAQPNGFAYCLIELPLPSFYLVTLLSNLNARGYIRGRRTEWNEYLTQIPDPSWVVQDQSKDFNVHVLSDFVVARDGCAVDSGRHSTMAGSGTAGSTTVFSKPESDDDIKV